MTREIVLDTETTGLDPRGGDRLVEIGCVELVNHIPSGQVWHEYFNPERDMPRAAFEVHGLSTDFLSDKLLFADHAASFLEFIGDAPLIIHNASFDVGFLNAELERIGCQLIDENRTIIDTLALARRKHPGAQNSLDALCRRYQINASTRTKHGALIDAEILTQVYAELTGGHQARFELHERKRRVGSRRGRKAVVSQRPEPLPQRLSDDEREAHQAFVGTLGESALWNIYLKTKL